MKCHFIDSLELVKVSHNELKKGTKYYFVEKYDQREYIGMITVVLQRNFMVKVITSYDPYTQGVPHIGTRYMISDFMNVFEVVPTYQRRMEQKAFHQIMIDLIPGFNLNYL